MTTLQHRQQQQQFNKKNIQQQHIPQQHMQQQHHMQQQQQQHMQQHHMQQQKMQRQYVQQPQQFTKKNIQQQHIQQDNKGRPLPKFGEWDVKNPASAEGFTMIFNKARDDKKTTKAAVMNIDTTRMSDPIYNNDAYHSYPKRKSSKWFCCV